MAQEIAHRQITFLNQQLEVLQNEANRLKYGIDIYSTRVINEVKFWMDCQEIDQVKFIDLLQKVQDAIGHMAEKSKEINDFSELQKITKATVNPSPVQKSASVTILTVVPEVSSCPISKMSDSSSSKDNKEIKKYLARLEILEEAFSSLKYATKNVESKQEQFDKWIEATTEKLTNHDEEIDALSKEMSKVKKTHENQIKALEKQFQSLKKTVEDITSQNGYKFDELMEEMLAASDFMSNLKENLEFVSSKVEENVAKLDTVESKQYQMTHSLMEQNKNLTSCGTELKDINDKYGMLCQTLTKRLLPLAALQKALNNKKTSIEENKNKLSSLEMKITDPSKTDIQQSCAFSATTKEKQVIDPDSQAFKIKKFCNISGNAGNNFDPMTGEFTAPFNGLYFISITLKNMNDFSILGQMLIYDPDTKETRGGFCFIERLLPQMCQCTATIVELQKEKKMFIRLHNMDDKNDKLDLHIKLVCLFIK